MSDHSPLLPPSGQNEPPPPYHASAPAGDVPAGSGQAGSTYNYPPASAGGQYGTYAGPPGYQPVSNQQPTYLQPQPVPVTSVIVVGGCPACRVGVLEDDFTCLGICCAIFFFPLGLICCLLMRQRRCPNCGAIFG